MLCGSTVVRGLMMVRAAAAVAACAGTGCIASPVTTPGYVDMRPTEPGAVDVGGDGRVLGVSGAAWTAGGTLRVTPVVREGWSLPIEAGAYPTIQRNGVILGSTRVGVRRQMRPWFSLGGGVSGNYLRRSIGHGCGGGADAELAFGKT
ncbi:MAG: hypothetical protein K0V04_15770, partial [Deltaproteobacteria bacterium]|nr:hypothetical protein [Deltaproteobacteria bacterium]